MSFQAIYLIPAIDFLGKFETVALLTLGDHGPYLTIAFI